MSRYKFILLFLSRKKHLSPTALNLNDVLIQAGKTFSFNTRSFRCLVRRPNLNFSRHHQLKYTFFPRLSRFLTTTFHIRSILHTHRFLPNNSSARLGSCTAGICPTSRNDFGSHHLPRLLPRQARQINWQSTILDV